MEVLTQGKTTGAKHLGAYPRWSKLDRDTVRTRQFAKRDHPARPEVRTHGH